MKPTTSPRAGKKTIAAEIAELRGMSIPELVARYEQAFGKPPRSKHREHLWRRIAWRIQEQRFGGLSTVAKRKLDELIAELDLPLGGDRTIRGRLEQDARRSRPTLGTTLYRTWKGREVRATAVEGGWECDGIVHRSLTAVARHVTGTHTSGPAFFRLNERRRR